MFTNFVWGNAVKTVDNVLEQRQLYNSYGQLQF